MTETEHDQHDRTWRFVQTAFPWTKTPTIDALGETASSTTVTLTASRAVAASPQGQVMLLAVGNIVGRLPVGLRVAVPDATREAAAPPYQGARLLEAVDDLGRRLAAAIDIVAPKDRDGFSAEIITPTERIEWRLATDGWLAYMGREPAPLSNDYNPASAYLAACMLGGEVLRAWARHAARTRAGAPAPAFEGRARPATDRWLSLWAPGTTRPGPDADASTLPAIDWAAAGAVNQAALAVLAPTPGWSAAGTVTDPKTLDRPDLNRSLLSFIEDIGKAKAEVAAERSSGGRLHSTMDYFPTAAAAASTAPWIVAGTDDVRVRADIQRLWPERLIVTATEDVFGYVGWHAPERTDLACAGCAPVDGSEPEERIPTSAPTSAAAGVVTAATLLRLAAVESVPARTDVLTLRLDAPHALDGTNPKPAPGCATCSNRGHESFPQPFRA